MLRYFLPGAVLGIAFPGFLPGLFIAVPVFFAGIFLFVGPVFALHSWSPHPAIGIMLGLGFLFIVLRGVSWARIRFPMVSAIALSLVIGGFYGLMAYLASDGDWIWVAAIGIASAAYTYRKVYAYNIVESELRLDGLENAY